MRWTALALGFFLGWSTLSASAQEVFGITLRTKNGGGAGTQRIRVQTNANDARIIVENAYFDLEPVATPATPTGGTIYFDGGSNLLRYYDGTTWHDLMEYSAGAGISVSGAGVITNTGDTDASNDVTSVTASGPLASSGGTTPNLSLTGTVGIANGGTGLSGTPTNGQLPIGNGAGYTLSTLTAGTAISVTNGAGSISIANTGDTDASNDITTSTAAGGDLSGTYPNPTVDGLQGNAVSSTAPGAGQVLEWNGAAWAPGTDDTGGGGAPVGATYIVVSLDGTLTAERTIAVSNGLGSSDGGANGAYTISGPTLSSGGAGLSTSLAGTTWTITNTGDTDASNDITGSGTATRVAFFSGAQALSSSANLYWDNTNSRLGVGTAGPGNRLHVDDSTAGATALYTTNSYAGASDGYGIYAYSVNQDWYGVGGRFTGGWRGVQGDVSGTGTNDYTAVLGVGSTTGAGGTVYGILGQATGGGAGTRVGAFGGAYDGGAQAAIGVYAYTNQGDGFAVYGLNDQMLTNAIGVEGVAGDGSAATEDVIGVYGLSNNTQEDYGYGGWFQGEWFGVYALNPTVTSGYGLVAENDQYTVGNTYASGTKFAVLRTSQGPRGLSVIESPEIWFEDVGEGRLENGRAVVQLDPLFLETVTISEDQPMRVFVSPTQEIPGGFYVLKHDDGFEVVQSGGGTASASFDWRVMAKRRGYETVRFAVVPAYHDRTLYPDRDDPEIPPEWRQRIRSLRDLQDRMLYRTANVVPPSPENLRRGEGNERN